jgi:hypothetical protein
VDNRAIHSEVVVLGAGPAGLSAANACIDHGIQPLVLERGKPVMERDRQLSFDIADGIGGAGLFSDGKFSFFPSATRLWTLEPNNMLSEAYEWCSRLLRAHGIVPPPFPDNVAVRPTASPESKDFHDKEYPSLRMPLDSRQSLIQQLNRFDGDVRTQSEVIELSSEKGRIELTVRNTRKGSNQLTHIDTKAIIVATGRLGAIDLLRWVQAPSQFRRIEVGIRIEQPAENFFLRSARTLDPKLIAEKRSGIEWRTFCCCRGGEVVEVLSNGILGVAGRSDCAPTGCSNIAFHVRITDPEVGRPCWEYIVASLRGNQRVMKVELSEIETDGTLQASLEQIFGVQLTSHLLQGFNKLVQHYQLVGPITIYAPSVEGVGTYPIVDARLQMPGFPIWLPGDVAGMFRGLTASLVSGYFAGLQCREYLCNL